MQSSYPLDKNVENTVIRTINMFNETYQVTSDSTAPVEFLAWLSVQNGYWTVDTISGNLLAH